MGLHAAPSTTGHSLSVTVTSQNALYTTKLAN